MPRAVEPGRSELRGVTIDAELAVWLRAESKRRNQGDSIIVEAALRDYRAAIVAHRQHAFDVLAEAHNSAPVPPDPGSG